MKRPPQPSRPAPRDPPAPVAARTVAVIDVGTTSVRMEIAQIDRAGAIRPLDSLQQAVSLGKDTFTDGFIGPDTTESCVEALRSFRRVLDEYHIHDAADVRAVATSAVREAANRESFLDRLYAGSGITVEAIDAAEVNRYTYLSVKPLLRSEPLLRRAETLVVEVGGGSTEVLVMHAGKVTFSYTLRLGSLRMRETAEDAAAPGVRLPALLEHYIGNAINEIRQKLSLSRQPHLLALGSDMRFAAARIGASRRGGSLVRVPVPELLRLAAEILRMPVDEVVRRYQLPYQEAECLGPALLCYARLASALHLPSILATDATMRDGLAAELVTGTWTREFFRQVIRSAFEMARKYEVDLRHSRRVAGFALKLFRALRELHGLHPRYELILMVAALLHDVGLFVSNRSHHKHSFYLIRNSDLFGLGARDMLLAALVARYHRKAMPNPLHEGYSTLDREGRMAVAKMAAILRVADALDPQGSHHIRRLDVALRPGRLLLTARDVADAAIEQLELQQKGPMFQQVFGLEVVLRHAGPVQDAPQ